MHGGFSKQRKLRFKTITIFSWNELILINHFLKWYFVPSYRQRHRIYLRGIYIQLLQTDYKRV